MAKQQQNRVFEIFRKKINPISNLQGKHFFGGRLIKFSQLNLMVCFCLQNH